MAPPGTKVNIHEKPIQRRSWDPHGVEGWYLGPAMEHYCRYSVFTNATQAGRTSDTVEFFPQKFKVSFLLAIDIAVRAANELVQVLQRPQPANPFSQVGTQQLEALQQLTNMFQSTTNKVASLHSRNR